jgi:hypothetical protein
VDQKKIRKRRERERKESKSIIFVDQPRMCRNQIKVLENLPKRTIIVMKLLIVIRGKKYITNNKNREDQIQSQCTKKMSGKKVKLDGAE